MTSIRLKPELTAFQRPSSRISEDDLRQQYNVEKVYHLAQNENPLGPSPRAIAVIQQLAPTLAYYPDFSDLDLRQAIVDVIGGGITADHIYTGCSGYESLELLARGFLDVGDEVIVSTPTFSIAYDKVVAAQGANIVDVPLHPRTFAYDVDGVLAAITDKTRLIMVCNPNNPTGTLITADEMDALMAGVPEHVLVVADEVYHHFVDDPAFPDSLRYVREGRNIVIIHSFSKGYGLAGLRLGYGIAKPDLADYLGGLHRGFHQNKLSLAAGVAACQDQAHLQRIITYLKAERRWMLAELDRLHVHYWQPAANFILIETQLPAADLSQKMLERGIIIRPQHGAGLPYAVRVSLGTHEANTAFITALESILA